MIFTCEGCKTKYMLDDEKVPERGIRVRCPKCSHVWRLMRETAEVERESVFEVTSSTFDEAPARAKEHASGWAAMEGDYTMRSSSAVAEEVPIAEVDLGIGEHVTPQTRQVTPELKKKKERAKRLARVFVSDILIYNKEKRDKALKEGNLMSVLGPEIKKAWEAYKEKVGPDLTESTEYFRSALNEILADGQELF